MAHSMLSQESLISDQSLRERQLEIRQLPPDESKRLALEYARNNKLPERLAYKNGTVLEIRKLSSLGHPMYYKTFNLNAAETISANKVWEGASLGFDLSGTGIAIGLWDAGVVRTSHDEFEGRARIIDLSAEIDYHATHVAGTIGAGGIKPSAHGMAHLSTIESYDWDNDNEEMRNAASQGLLISNHSYGFVQGWEYNQDNDRWEWWGNVNVSEKEDYNFGFYGSEAREWDDIALKYPKYLIVKSAGNDRGEGPAPGATHYYLSGGTWKQSNKVRELDGGADSYDCVGTQGTSKNILTIGAVDDIPGGYESPSDIKLASFSAFGPTDDGRIKPDIVANGISLYSTSSDSDQSYGYSSGTSMSAPSVSGSLALLQEQYYNLNGDHMTSSQLKALVIHTADEAGNEGPDYRHGWGLINVASAAELLSQTPFSRFVYDTLENEEIKEYTFFSRGDEEVRISIVWTDKAGKVPQAQLNPTDRILVNDLDIRLTRQMDNYLYRPFILDPANPSHPAVTGDNYLDNVEQIYISQPTAGFYTLQLSHKKTLSGNVQPYSLVITGLVEDYVSSGDAILEEANGSILLTSAEHYPNNMDVSWLIQPSTDQPVSFYFELFETEENNDVLTIFDGKDESAPVIARLSGSLTSLDTVFTSTSDQMFVKFTSDDQGTAKGFLAKYCTIAPEGEYTITGEKYPCQFTTSSYFSVGQEGADFTWVSSEGWNLEMTTLNGVDLEVGEQQGSLTVSPYNRCGTGTSSDLSIQAQLSTPVLSVISGDTLPCAGWSSMLSVNAIPGASYQWELPGTWAGASETDTMFYIPSANSGVVSVTGSNDCGIGNTTSIDIEVLSIPDRPLILTEKVPPCSFTLHDFYVTPTPGYDYFWEVEDDWRIPGSANEDSVSVEIGAAEGFLYLTATNLCGEKKGSRLLLTAPVPEAAYVIKYTGDKGLPELEVTNMELFESIQWYKNGAPVQGESGSSNPLVVNMNGLYGAESISEEGCRNLGEESDYISVEDDHLAYLAYRVDETKIVIENATQQIVDFSLVNMSGQVMMIGKANPGYNEIPFLETGIFLLGISGNNVDQKYKVLL